MNSVEVPPSELQAETKADSSDTDTELAMLLSLGFRLRTLEIAQKIAQRDGVTRPEVLIRLGYLNAEDWWTTVAQFLGLRYFRELYLDPKPIDAPLPDRRYMQSIRQVWHRDSDRALLVAAPIGVELDELRHAIERSATVGRRHAIAAPQTIRRAVRRSFEPAFTRHAINLLRRQRPTMSAAIGFRLARRLIVCFIIASILAFIAPILTLFVFDLIFLTAGGLRLAAAVARNESVTNPVLSDMDLPTYAVLVPLYREAKVIGELLQALARIDYPPQKIEILLLIEADDRETLAAAARLVVGTRVRILAVPPSLPRTKPKALAYALPFVDSELLTVFDAEDRPAPDQLRRAAAAFANGSANLVCVQAMLDIDHAVRSRNWIARQFALEYRVLFRVLLPWLGHRRLFLPLGGTSNHFRRRALVTSGGWDPFNVTEDADLAVRFCRLGGQIATIPSVTDEEAPLHWQAWHMQRTRWMKGWLQTWLVHTRYPMRLLADLGVCNFIVFQVLIIGQILSALAYPFGVAIVLVDLTGIVPLFADRPFADDLILAVQLVALALGWLGTVAALLATSRKDSSVVRLRDLASIPIYWLLIFAAAISAIAELIVDPYRWNKTGHGIAERTPRPKAFRFPPRSTPLPARSEVNIP